MELVSLPDGIQLSWSSVSPSALEDLVVDVRELFLQGLGFGKHLRLLLIKPAWISMNVI
jgi:hypothetical protein